VTGEVSSTQNAQEVIGDPNHDQNMKRLVLVVHTEKQVFEACRRILGKEGYRVEYLSDPSRATELILKHTPCVLLTAIRMPEKDGFEVLSDALSADPALPVIAITTHATIPGAVGFLNSGGANYLAAPFKAGQLVDAVHEAMRKAAAGAGSWSVANHEPRPALDSIIGTSRSVLELKRMILKVSRTDVSVLIIGETGTGKEMVATAIHESSPRSRRPFLPVDCAALPPTLLESELFGHEKGAFTGADRSRPGLFESANLGTIFLDEIGELDVSTQSKLFRVLQEGKIRQIGGRSDTLIDVRVIAATNRDLEKGLRDGTFREELYFRLNVVALALDPLRKRKKDIPLLVDHFFRLFRRFHGSRRLSGLDSSYMEALLEYDWPGNIRELRNVIERSVVLADGPQLTEADVVDTLANEREIKTFPGIHAGDHVADYSDAREEVIDSFDREYFQRLLSLYQGNLSEAARKSGIGRKTLYNKLKRIGIIPFDASGSG